jgi:pyruvate dehydrogenase (quinone)
MGLRYPTEVNLWGDAKATLTALLPLLHRTEDRSWQERVAEEMRGWEREMAAQADVRYPDGVNPRHVVHELNARLPERAIVTTDVGTTADWYGHHIRLRRGMQGDVSGRNASMFSSMPYAVAAKFAASDRTVVCMIGDGAFQMLGMNELITVLKYRKRWANSRFVVIVMHNDDLSQVSWEMRTEDGNPVYSGSQDVESVDYAGWAELLGFTGVQVRSDDDVVPAIEAALDRDGVTLIDAYVTKNIAPLPAHITLEFAMNTAKALLKGDPRELGTIVDSAEGLVAEQVERVKGAFRR